MKKTGVLGIIGFPMFLSFLGIVSAQTTGWESVGGFGQILRFIFGTAAIPDVNAVSAMIVTVAIWLLIVVTFGDIVSTFSSFSKWVSWVIAVMVGLIAANLNVISASMAKLTGIFAWAGVFAVYVGLGAAFVAFLAVNLGITSLAKWVMNRKAMMIAAKEEAGGKKLEGTIRGLGSVGQALKDLGEKN